MSSIRIVNRGGLSWNIFNRIKEAAFDAQGVLFGGAVRDTIAHNHAASLFYEKVEKGLYDETQYNDIFIDRETHDRFILPSDIDITFYAKSDLKKFKESLIRTGFIVTYESEASSPSDYFKNFPEGWLHSKWLVSVKMPKMLLTYTNVADIPSYNVDVIYPDPTKSVMVNRNMLPPFGIADFECNALVLTKIHGQETFLIDNKFLTSVGNSALSRQKTIDKIIDDIIHKKATFIGSNDMKHRVRKMIYRNYAIQSNSVHVTYTTPQKTISSFLTAQPSACPCSAKAEEDDASICIICLQDNKEDFVQLKCCKQRRYHPQCLRKTMDFFNHCPNCRKEFFANPCDKFLLGELADFFDDPMDVKSIMPIS